MRLQRFAGESSMNGLQLIHSSGLAKLERVNIASRSFEVGFFHVHFQNCAETFYCSESINFVPIVYPSSDLWMLFAERFCAMNDIVSKKRDRALDDFELPADAIQPNKKLLLDIFTSLNLGEPNSVYEVGTITECTSSDFNNTGTGMDTESPGEVISNANIPSSSSTQLTVHNQESDNMYSILKNGTRKYGRRVDYLVDDLIRKSQKTFSDPGGTDFDFESVVPSSIGPHPLTDRLLGKLWPTVVPTEEGVSMLSLIEYPQYGRERESNRTSASTSTGSMDLDMYESDGSSDEMNEMVADCEKVVINSTSSADLNRDRGIKDGQNCSINNQGEHHAGLITHSEWGIEDVN